MSNLADLEPARRALAEAIFRLSVWRDHDLAGDVVAGHDAVGAIDATLRALHAARAALLDEIHGDEAARSARVDQLLRERFGDGSQR